MAPPGCDSGVIRVPGSNFGIAMSVDCNARLVALDPYEGGKAAVAEAARNVASSGAKPLGITNCLNFGNPEKPDVFFQFREACRGIGDACRAFGTPVTGGNVSFYNESPTGAVDPTPTIGMIGLLDDEKTGSPAISTPRAMRCSFWAKPAESWAGQPIGPTSAISSEAIRRRWISMQSFGCNVSWWPRPSAGCCGRRTTAPRAVSRWRWRKP